MEDTVFSPSTVLGAAPSSIMDIDVMDELLLEGCWLETMCGSEFLQHSPMSNIALCDPLYPWPSPEENQAEPKRHESGQGSLVPSDIQVVGQNPGIDINYSSDLRRTWWIGPSANPATSVTDRLIRALGYIQDFTKDKDVLIQLWVPVNRGGKRVLTTSEQPFSLNPSSRRLSRYRDISVNYQFSAEEENKEMVGMPSRVFLGKVPEWTPDVRFFRSDEYPRVDHAQQFDVRGTLALPVFEQGSRTCLGVIEVVMTTQKIKYRPEIESVCKALEAVDLRSSQIFSSQNLETCPKSYEAALPEILEVLRSACTTHGLPLAQTWVSCTQQGKGGCRHSDENLALCVSPVDTACHVADPRVQGFHEACSEHHLLKGQGVAGKAFLTNQPCFSPDITSFTKTDYPLSHHARMFGLCGAVAIRFRSVQTGSADFVLEFFLPMECKDLEAQTKMLTSLSVIIQQICRNLRVVRDDELREEMKVSPLYQQGPNNSATEPGNDREGIQKRENVSLDLDGKVGMVKVVDEKSGIDFWQQSQSASLNTSSEHGEDRSVFVGGVSVSGMERSGDRKRCKAEKTITLQVLRQYFAGSLKDAAKSLGVCPTTLKRICRQHGINRWPSRKIKKVGHSLQKLQVVIDSVQGTSGSLQIGSFYTNFPELVSPNVSTTGPFSIPNPSDPQNNNRTTQRPGVNSNSGPQSASSKSPSSSCSHSSGSSQYCSSVRQPLHSSTFNSEDDASGQLKRVRSEVELSGPSHDGLEPKLPKEACKVEPNPPSGRPFYGNDGSFEWETMRVKVSYGEENIRFRLQKGWGVRELWEEIGKRFSVDEPSRFDLKYLDDDLEWVLLTCDADLEECIDVSRSAQGNTIRLSLQASHHYIGSSVASSGHL